MATFTYRSSTGLTGGYLNYIEPWIPQLVAKAAKDVSWNHLSAPKNFGQQTVTDKNGTVVKNIHEASGVEFKSGFQMYQEDGQQKWEGQAKHNDIRLDLQGIENNWANWAIQIAKKGQADPTVATCLMQINIAFSQRHLVGALISSARKNMICELTA